MPKRARTRSPSPQAPHGAASLVDWREPARNSHLLDWRERAHEYGLVPLDENGAVDRHVVEPIERLIEEHEPEAFEEQPVDENGIART